MLRTENIADQIISVTELRRNFERVTKNLARIDTLILTRRGEPFATLKAITSEKKKFMSKSAGVWKGTELDDDKIWREVGKRKSRLTAIKL